MEANPGAEEQQKRESQFCARKTLIYNIAGFVLVVFSGQLFWSLFKDEKDEDGNYIMLDWSENDRKGTNAVTTLGYIGCALSTLIFIVSSLSKRVIFRCIPCLSLGVPTEVTRITTLIMQVLAIGIATILVIN